jgi:7-cyano-7-deazaguanine synthase
MNQKLAVVLLSGGIDSSTTVAIAKAEGFDIYALSFDYGQRHKIELEAAANVAKFFEVKEHLTIEVPLRRIGGSALTDDIAVPKDIPIQSIGQSIPVTYVPARNTIFLSLALAWAEVKEAQYIYIGVNALDYSGYPDCRPEFIKAFETMANLATQKAVEGNMKFTIRCPLIEMSKSEIIEIGLNLGVDYSMTHSCYDPSDSGEACQVCESCLLRKRGFEDAGIPDPTKYRS